MMVVVVDGAGSLYLLVLCDGLDVHDWHVGVKLLQPRLGYGPYSRVPPGRASW